jgi:hypothetical protein
MPDYTKTIIYKLINYDYPDLVYVGSTTNFTKRKQNHKVICLNEKYINHNLKVYASIREKDGWENWHMIKICDYPCNNKREAELEEDKYMTELKANMNCHRASRTKQQYREDIKEKIQEYYDTNKEKIQEYKKEYYETNKEKQKEYYETNKSTILEKNKIKIKCECGCDINKQNLNRHQKSKKHIDLMKCI